MTNGWVDIKNTDMMLIMGGNPAENHPCGFKWPIEAKRTRNAKMIVVDPRFTRTAAVADLFCQIRAGADIAFLGGVVHYAIENNRIAKDYLLNYTNAAFVVKNDFKLPADTDGVFSGFDEQKQSYDRSTWNYAGTGPAPVKSNGKQTAPASVPPPLPPLPEKVEYDLTLQNPNCVYQLLRKHYSRYTPEMVERITGIPKEQFLKAADLFTSVRKDGDMKKVATVIYAVGWTQHTFGTQIIRTAAILQLLMGNVGRAGGGVNALRGHSNIQGATDMAGIFDNLPGYLKVPTPADENFDAWMKRITPKPAKPAPWDSFNYWGNTPKFAVSFLKAFYGDAATKQTDWAFNYLPKVDRNYSWVQMWDNMYNGIVKGIFAFGMNGVAIGPDSKKNIDALKKADWLVVGEIYPDETSEFWKSPGITTDEMKQIQTTVYRLPCAGFAEKDGTFTNSARWLQWKNAALPMPGDCRLDQALVAQIFLKVRDLYKRDGGKFPDPILKLTWGYTDPSNPSLAEVLKEINGKALADLEDPATKQQIKTGQASLG
jgi:formate dehydrogenase major subunit